jgi:hypothetical protein
MPAIVVDLDGTLSDHSHRAHLAIKRDWNAYNAAAYLDPPHKEVIEFLKDARVGCPECEHILLTARSDAWYIQTGDWLKNIGATSLFDTLLMRPKDDMRSDAIIKPLMLIEHFGGNIARAKSEVRMILEDRTTVVNAWREIGFKCWQVRADIMHEETIYTQGGD